jgi:aminotransferase
MLCASSMGQKAAIEALARPDSDIGEMVNEYRRRRNFIAAAFEEMGIECHRPLGAFYAFPSVAKFDMKSKDFAMKFLSEEKVAVVPGTAFGECGEGFVRCAYATSMENLKEAMVRLKRFIGKLS